MEGRDHDERRFGFGAEIGVAGGSVDGVAGGVASLGVIAPTRFLSTMVDPRGRRTDSGAIPALIAAIRPAASQ